MHIHLYQYDLPSTFKPAAQIAIDTEAMGLKTYRDRLCVVQISNGDGECHVIHFPKADYSQSPNLTHILKDDSIQKIFHFARFDVGILMHTFKLMIQNIYCTKIASKLVRTYTDKHGLKDLLKQYVGVEISKQEQTSDWGSPVLTKDQQRYAATDVLHLHKLAYALDKIIEREQRQDIAKACFDFLPYRAQFDLMAGEEYDIFKYKSD